MEYNGKSKEEYIAELKKKYGELAEPELFDDDIYIKIEQGMQAYEKGKYYTKEEFEQKIKEFREKLHKDFESSKVIAEPKERYNVNGKI